MFYKYTCARAKPPRTLRRFARHAGGGKTFSCWRIQWRFGGLMKGGSSGQVLAHMLELAGTVVFKGRVLCLLLHMQAQPTTHFVLLAERVS